ncbi:MAG TPA: FmdB family zinc ribbon protein, partial [Nocardioides sp.]|nr:FmdB family zinc ribbon protein [Nocardioides sp.]
SRGAPLPTYQYACTECGHAFEQVQSFSDDALTVCPECQGRLRKLFNAVGVVFKGSGFYRTDSRAKETSGASSSSDSSSSDSASSDSSSSYSSSSTSPSTTSSSSDSSSSSSSGSSSTKSPQPAAS